MPILDQREEEKAAAGQIGFQNMRQAGKKIGNVNYKEEGKWRCATCKMANDNEMETCVRCKDPRRHLIEKKPTGGMQRSNSDGTVKHPPMRFTLCKKEPKNKQEALERVR